MEFRKDINGLRAIAVIAVVLFHFNSDWIPGGFAGVDVFFVISGFLMTGIIFKGLELDNFSIMKFYLDRANRIVPALASLCFVLLIFGWFYLTPLEYKALGKHAASSISFLSNIIYWKESGYFDSASYGKWLLHTWSLSVEWQFYIIYPLTLIVMRKFISLKSMKFFLLISAIIGFLFCVYSTYEWPDASYYLLTARAWEMIFGGVAYLYPINIKNKKIVELIGFGLILISYFYISEIDLWPGYWSIIPVFGSFLIIQAQRSSSLITGNIFFQKIGSWSYSIYLWHWPLVVFIYYFSLPDQYSYIGLVLSVILGCLSKKYIESIRFKSGFFKFNDFLRYQPLYMVFIIGMFGSSIFINNGFSFHYPESVVNASNEESNKNPRRAECHVSSGIVPECIYGKGNLGVIVLGDSHAQSIIRSIEKSLPNNKSVMDWTMASCTTIKNLYFEKNGHIDKSCGEFVSYAIKSLHKYPDIPVVIDNRYSAMLLGPNEPAMQSRREKIEKLIPTNVKITGRNIEYFNLMNTAFFDTICEISQTNPVFLLEQTPEMKYHVPKNMSKELMRGNSDFRVKIKFSEYEERNKIFSEIASRLKKECNVNYIPVKDKFCDSQFCYGDIDGRPVFFDDDHLSEFGASQLIPRFKDFLTSKLIGN